MSKRAFTAIAIEDMAELLSPDKGWRNGPHRKEYVFDWGFKRYPGIVIRVYTSIDRNSGIARGLGNDAIRVCAVDTNANKGLVKAARVLRVTNWRVNLKNRIWEVMNTVRDRRGDKPLPNPDKKMKKANLLQ